jgi:Tfp pilus assembly protein PilV
VKTIRKRLGLDRRSDESGLSLIEVVVAMMIFTIISTGLLYTMLNLLSVTRDSRARQVATNLAAQEIDLVRDANDIFKVGDRTTTVKLNGDTFSILRSSSWVVNGTSTTACGTGSTAATGTLRFKQVHVQITWGGMRDGALPVVSDTLINPNDRLSDPELSTILVSVQNGTGVGLAGASITATATTGSNVYTTTTDAQGCGFFLKVTPGSYNVVLTHSSGLYVDEKGVSAPTQLIVATAGASASAPFIYDKAATFKVTYSPTNGGNLPTNLPTTLLSTRNPVTYTATNATSPRTLSVFPSTDGYTPVTGIPAQCPASDPTLWTANLLKADGVAAPLAIAAPGTTTNVTLPMQSVRVKGLSGNGNYIVAMTKYLKAADGRPLCAPDPATPPAQDPDSAGLVTQYYRFAATNSSNYTIALPYGTYEIHTSKTAGFTPSSSTKISASNLDNAPTDAISVLTGTVTFDPRADIG